MAENATPQDAQRFGDSPETGAPSPGPEGEAITPPDEPGPGSAPGTEPVARETNIPPRQPDATDTAPAPAAPVRPAPARAAPARAAAARAGAAEPASADVETVATEP